MSGEKNVWVAVILNFFFWGTGYFYLNKQVVKGFIAFILYCSIWLFSILLMLLLGYPLIFPIIFWIEFWNLWCSIFLAYDTFKISKVKPRSLKIQKVKKIVRRSKVRTKRK